MELVMEALKEVQERFYRDFPPHPEEERYAFATPSTMKPTQFSYPGGWTSWDTNICFVFNSIQRLAVICQSPIVVDFQEVPSIRFLERHRSVETVGGSHLHMHPSLLDLQTLS